MNLTPLLISRGAPSPVQVEGEPPFPDTAQAGAEPAGSFDQAMSQASGLGVRSASVESESESGLEALDETDEEMEFAEHSEDSAQPEAVTISEFLPEQAEAAPNCALPDPTARPIGSGQDQEGGAGDLDLGDLIRSDIPSRTVVQVEGQPGKGSESFDPRREAQVQPVVSWRPRSVAQAKSAVVRSKAQETPDTPYTKALASGRAQAMTHPGSAGVSSEAPETLDRRLQAREPVVVFPSAPATEPAPGPAAAVGGRSEKSRPEEGVTVVADAVDSPKREADPSPAPDRTEAPKTLPSDTERSATIVRMKLDAVSVERVQQAEPAQDLPVRERPDRGVLGGEMFSREAQRLMPQGHWLWQLDRVERLSGAVSTPWVTHAQQAAMENVALEGLLTPLELKGKALTSLVRVSAEVQGARSEGKGGEPATPAVAKTAESAQSTRGMDSAKSRISMKMPLKEDPTASRTLQDLPVTIVTDLVDESVPTAVRPVEDLARLHLDRRGVLSLEIKAWEWMRQHPVSPLEMAPDVSGLESGEAVAGEVSPLSRVERAITREVIMIRQLRADSITVVLRPDAETEMVLNLAHHNGRVEAQVRCDARVAEMFQRHWPQLQESLAQQNVQLGPLRENPSSSLPQPSPGASDDALGSADSSDLAGGSSRRHDSPRRDDGEAPTGVALKSNPAERRRAGAAVRGRRVAHTGWESWA